MSRENLLRNVDQAWRGIRTNRGLSPDDLISLTTERLNTLFDPQQDSRTIVEDPHGLTAVSAIDPSLVEDPLTILGAQLAPDRSSLAIEIHNHEQQTHPPYRNIDYMPRDCRALQIDLQTAEVAYLAVRGAREKAAEVMQPMHEPYRAMCLAMGVKALMRLCTADGSSDILSGSGYPRRTLMRTHCAQDPKVQAPADTFFLQGIKEAISSVY